MSIERSRRDIVADLHTWTRTALAGGRPPCVDSAVTCSNTPTIVRDAMLRAAYACNSRHPMFTLPDALLTRILGFVDLHYRWSISQTCRHLRTRCLATPTLWNTIPIRGFGSLARIATSSFSAHINLLAERSYPEVLDIRVNYVINCTADEEAVVGLVLPLLPRLRYLELSHTTRNGEWGELRHILEGPAPAIEEVVITRLDGFSPVQSAILPSALFSGSSGRLRSLQLRNVGLPKSPCQALSTVQVLRLGDQDNFDVGVEEFCHILSLMPLLEELELTVRCFKWSEGVIAIPASCVLRRFSLWATFEVTNLSDCLRNLHSLSRCSISTFSGFIASPLPVEVATWVDALTAFLGMASTVLVVHRCHPPSVASPLTIRAASLMYSTRNLGLDFLYSLPLGTLTQLSIHEFYWPPVTSALSLPALRWLRVALGSCSSYQTSGGTYLSILSRWDLAVWDTPALETLVISHVGELRSCQQLAFDWPGSMQVPAHCFCCKPLAVALEDVLRFISTAMLATGQRLRLSHLMLQGIEPVDQDPWAQLMLLQSLAHEVTISATANPVPGDRHDLDDP